MMKNLNLIDVKESVEDAWEKRKALRAMIKEYRKANARCIELQEKYLSDMESSSYFNKVVNGF